MHQFARNGRGVRIGAAFRLVAALAILSGFGLEYAAAQRLPLVPDPITTPELSKYADLLELSREQTASLLPIHDAYKDRYEQFEDRDIRELQDQLIDLATGFWAGGFRIPPRKAFEDLMDQYQRVLRRAQAIDRSFFDGLGGMLSEEQMLTLQRARQTRELAVYRVAVVQILGGINPGAGVDLTEMTKGLDLDPDVADRIEPILIDTETRCARTAKIGYDRLMDAATAILDTIDELGLRDMTPDQMQEFFMKEEDNPGPLMARFDEVSAPVQDVAHQMSQVNLRALRRIESQITGDPLEELRDRYCQRVYDDFYHGPGEWRDRYRRALEMDALGEDQHEAIRAQRAQYVRQDRAIVDDLIDASEKMREFRSAARLAGQIPDPHRERAEKAEEKRRELNDTANAALDSILGPQLVKRLDTPTKEGNEGSGGRSVTIGVGVGPGGAETVVEVDEGANGEGDRAIRWRMDLLPSPMTIDEFTSLAEDLDSSPDDALLRTVFEDYRDAYGELREQPLLEVVEGTEPTPAEIADARTARHEALGRLDDKLFEELSLVVSESRQSTVRRHHGMRARAVARRTAERMTWSIGNEEAEIDLMAVALECEPALDPESIGSALEDYERQIEPLITERLEQAREVQRRSEQMERLREDDSPAARRGLSVMVERWQEARQAMARTVESLAELNRETVDRLAAQLPDGAGRTLRHHYNKAAFPDIYQPGESTEELIRKVQESEIITPDQRDRIDRIAWEFREKYAVLSREMVDLRRNRSFEPSNFQFPTKEQINREMTLQRLDFKREELMARAKMKLRLTLSEDQLRQIPQLAR